MAEFCASNGPIQSNQYARTGPVLAQGSFHTVLHTGPHMAQYWLPCLGLLRPHIGPDIRNTYRLLFGYIYRANTGPDTII